MQTIIRNTYPTANNELKAVLAGAVQISREAKLSEVCTEALLYSLFEQPAIAGKLLKMGFNLLLVKKLLVKRLEAKGVDNPPKEPQYSVALTGLLLLNAMDKDATSSGIYLIKTIIVNNNTAAARMLKMEHICLDHL
jgi:hypothetical protein